jgi:hypothetical protein
VSLACSGAFGILVFFAFSESAFKLPCVVCAPCVPEGFRGLDDRFDGRSGFGTGACALSASVVASAAARSAARAASWGSEEGDAFVNLVGRAETAEAAGGTVALEARAEGSSRKSVSCA